MARAFSDSLMIILTMPKSESQVCITANKRNESFTRIIAKNGSESNPVIITMSKSEPCFKIIAGVFSESQSVDNSIWTQRVNKNYNNKW